jgi:hypothetical protein
METLLLEESEIGNGLSYHIYANVFISLRHASQN